MNSAFAQAVREGLTASPRRISSRFFYDAEGSRLFREITRQPEYYPYPKELEILRTYGNELAELCRGRDVELIDLGAGDATKTSLLLQAFADKEIPVLYRPLDISEAEIKKVEEELADQWRGVDIRGTAGDFFETLPSLERADEGRRFMLFLGSNIGNFPDDLIEDFLRLVASQMQVGDFFLLGIDLKKDPDFILPAYRDAAGVTAAFNLNLLRRINETFGGNFQVEKFKHYPVYDPVSGEMRSYLLSREDQEVRLEKLELKISFKAWEPIHLELSRKFSVDEIAEKVAVSGLNLVKSYQDKANWFADLLFQLS